MKTTRTSETKRRGRPPEHRLGDILAVMNVLARANSLANISEVACLLDMSEERANQILEQLCSQHDKDTTPLLPLCSTQNKGEYMRIDAPGSAKIKPLRLSAQQAAQCTIAFDEIGLSTTDSLRQKTVESFYPPEKTNLPDPKPRESSLEIGKVLKTCAVSLAQAKRIDFAVPSAQAPEVTFKYRGANDQIERTRHVVPTALHVVDGSWIVEAFDLDARSARTFRASLIKECALTNTQRTIPLGAQERPEGGTVELLCDQNAAARVLSWDGARVVSQEGNKTRIEVPYFRGDWLPRHVLALGSGVSYTNSHLRSEVKAVAQDNLKHLKHLKK